MYIMMSIEPLIGGLIPYLPILPIMYIMMSIEPLIGGLILFRSEHTISAVFAIEPLIGGLIRKYFAEFFDVDGDSY